MEERISPDGFIHLDGCEVYPTSLNRACSCGATGPHEGYATAVAREGIELPADGVVRTVELDGLPLSVGVRVLPAES